uniref:Uncharacterized protein n=1 Tax=Arundo donax TaxID=35708 RepID=A0A0A9B0A3_ARUDO
MLPNFDKF